MKLSSSVSSGSLNLQELSASFLCTPEKRFQPRDGLKERCRPTGLQPGLSFRVVTENLWSVTGNLVF